MEESFNKKQHFNGYAWKPQSCPICEIPPSRYLGDRGGTAHRQRFGVKCAIWKCGLCGLIFPNPMPTPVSGLDQHYDMPVEKYFANDDEVVRKKMFVSQLLEKAEKFINRKGNLLDIGSGKGEILRGAKEKGWSVKGIEPSKVFAKYASRHSRVEVRIDTLENCDFKTNSFDIVIMSATLEHMYAPDRTIKEVSRILRPGGYVYVNTPNEEGLYFRLGNLYEKLRGRNWVVNLSPTFPPFHIFGFSVRSLTKLLKKYALRPQEWRIYSYPWQESLPKTGGGAYGLEKNAMNVISAVGNLGLWGTYMQAWAMKE